MGEADKAIFEKLSSMARGHVAQQKNLLGLLPFNSDLPYHDQSQVSFEAVPSSYEEIVAIATLVSPNREEVFQQKIRNKPNFLESTYQSLADKKQLCVLMAHDDITDVAKVEAEIVIALCEYHASRHGALHGSAEWKRACNEYYSCIVGNFHIILSTIVRSIGVMGSPATDILRKVGWVHFSFPQTESMKVAGFDRNIIKSTNRTMLDNLSKALDENGGILTIAGPGSVDKQLEKDGISYRLIQPIRLGTYQLIAKMTIVPIAASLIGEKAFFEIGRPSKVRSLQEVQQMMHWIASASFAFTGQPTYFLESNSEMQEFMANYAAP